MNSEKITGEMSNNTEKKKKTQDVTIKLWWWDIMQQKCACVNTPSIQETIPHFLQI